MVDTMGRLCAVGRRVPVLDRTMRRPLAARRRTERAIVRTAWRGAVLLALTTLAGCYFPVHEKINKDLCDIAKQPFDASQMQAPDQAPTMPPASGDAIEQTDYSSADAEAGSMRRAGFDLPANAPELLDDEEIDHIILADGLAKHNRDRPSSDKFDPFKDLRVIKPRSLEVPPDLLPGGRPRPLDLGPLDSAQRRERLQREYPPLRPPGPDHRGENGPFGHPLTLAELQRLGLSNSPLIKQALARVESARGLAFQAGLPPNPLIGFEDDTFGTTGGAGYVGGFMEQLFVTGGKLRLRRAVAAMDLRNAEVALRRAQMDLATQIRTNYFQLLVARENMRINRLLVAFTNSVYEIQASEVRGRTELTIAAYEPKYLEYLAFLARTKLIPARHSYIMYWKQLTSTIGLPGLPLTEIAGSADMPIPILDFARVWTRIGQHHTDVVAADNSWHQARLSLLLAQAQLIPDVDARFLIQKDYTGPPNEIAPSFAVSAPLPIWNRNQGNITAAQADVVRLSAEPQNVRNNLYNRLAEAFYRYQWYRQNLAIYRKKILPDLVVVYDSIYHRYLAFGGIQMTTPNPAAPPAAPPGGGVGPVPMFQPPQPGINDVVVAQQFLITEIGNYITNLSGMWQAIVDVTDLIQTHDMFLMGQIPLQKEELPPLDLQQLKPLPPSSPCSPLQDPKLRGGDPTWPQAIPTRDNYFMPPADYKMSKKKATASPASVAQVDPQLSEPPPTVGAGANP
jgi:cobalt-zinc-cadmium efflux system outer membrane protein